VTDNHPGPRQEQDLHDLALDMRALFAIPEDGRPSPPLPTIKEAEAATSRVIRSIFPAWPALTRQAVSDVVWRNLVKPLLRSAEAWQGRALEEKDEANE
jgi:hypothetical protein